MVTATLMCKEIAGIKVPDRIKISGTEIHLNGAGVLSKFFVDQYLCALYLIQKTSEGGK
jgi:hypothetical protein